MKTVLKKSDPVLLVAVALAVLSAFWVKPDKTYMTYIDWRSLGILWSLMVIIQGFTENGVFEQIAGKLLKKDKNGWQLSVILVALCFFASMLITNDVSLLTFVPFGMKVLQSTGREDLICPVVVLQTIAANLGSMLTPIGNPQNLYLYGMTKMHFETFVLCVLPYTLLTAAMLLICLLFLPEKFAKANLDRRALETTKNRKNLHILIYSVLFVLALATVLRFIPWQGLLCITAGMVAATDCKILKRADYVLLLTFVGFFIFTGNIGRIPQIHQGLATAIKGREFLTAVLVSQGISNVPATLLLADFANNSEELLRGVNVGGLGTLIASMASLISYKAYGNAYGNKKGQYLIRFTAYNLLFLAGMLVLHALSNL
ncbi:Na+/H+ antiporter NhaD [Lachnospiraceae bacterium XBB1006]|nr:Na+/H+ antiporter NhaD [Lachnospiraceae bacterium XBB1006]